MDVDRLRDYFVHELKWGWGYQQQVVFDFLCDASEEAKGGVILDAGAGYQRYKPFFDDSIYVAQEHPIAGQQNKQILEYDILADVRTIPLRDETVDVVLSTSSLEHLEYPDRFFAESFRVLKPAGSLFINVPFIYMEHEVPYDFQRPTRYGLARHYANAGFERIHVSPTSSSIYTAQYFLLYAMSEDGKRIGREPWARAARKTLSFSARIMTRAAMKLLDKGPMDDTTFPIGWIAAGYKQGTKPVGSVYPSKRDFIEANAQCDDTVVLRQGRILPA